MKEFFGEELLLSSPSAIELYRGIKDLPIVDYHCHLDEKMIRDDAGFRNLGDLWLSGDHYKWRAMRLCGVDEFYITGGASDHEKYLKYAEIFPLLAGNPLYYWTQLELKLLFGIRTPLSAATAGEIWTRANEQLKTMTVRTILSRCHVEYIATTDDPASTLDAHGEYGGVRVSPTFRPDSALNLDPAALEKLAAAAGRKIDSAKALKEALSARLDHFVSKGCRIADHGIDFLPLADCGEEKAEELFARRATIDAAGKELFFSHVLAYLAGEYAARGMVMQMHFATFRNVNSRAFETVGRDAGFDVMRDFADVDRLAFFFDALAKKNALPKTVVYSLNPSVVPALTTLTGAFPEIRVGAAWWFNDTVAGIRRQLETVAEYAVLGTNLGMLTDSRSFASYVRFDFFRRILADFAGGCVERGEYDMTAAKELVRRVSYTNVREFLGV